jgi:hypothetical protein
MPKKCNLFIIYSVTCTSSYKERDKIILRLMESAAIPKKSLYEASTQFKNWRYSPEQLVQIRTSLNAAAVAVIRKTIEADEACHSLDHQLSVFH